MKVEELADRVNKVRDFLDMDKTELSNEDKVIIFRTAMEVTEMIGKMGDEMLKIIDKNATDKEEK